MEERNVKISLDKAREWYKKGGELKELALTVFSIKELDENIEWNYDKLLKKFAEKYPSGTVVWSNDGTDHYPHIIVSKPYLFSNFLMKLFAKLQITESTREPPRVCLFPYSKVNDFSSSLPKPLRFATAKIP